MAKDRILSGMRPTGGCTWGICSGAREVERISATADCFFMVATGTPDERVQKTEGLRKTSSNREGLDRVRDRPGEECDFRAVAL